MSEDLREFYTDDIFLAASVVHKTGRFPSEYIIIDSDMIGNDNRVTMKFIDIHIEFIRDLKAGRAKVEPLAFKKVFLQLKKQVLKISDQKKNGELKDESREPATNES